MDIADRIINNKWRIKPIRFYYRVYRGNGGETFYLTDYKTANRIVQFCCDRRLYGAVHGLVADLEEWGALIRIEYFDRLDGRYFRQVIVPDSYPAEDVTEQFNDYIANRKKYYDMIYRLDGFRPPEISLGAWSLDLKNKK